MITARQIQSEYWQAIIEQRQANLNLQQAIESYHDTPEYKAYKYGASPKTSVSQLLHADTTMTSLFSKAHFPLSEPRRQSRSLAVKHKEEYHV